MVVPNIHTHTCTNTPVRSFARSLPAAVCPYAPPTPLHTPTIDCRRRRRRFFFTPVASFLLHALTHVHLTPRFTFHSRRASLVARRSASFSTFALQTRAHVFFSLPTHTHTQRTHRTQPFLSSAHTAHRYGKKKRTDTEKKMASPFLHYVCGSKHWCWGIRLCVPTAAARFTIAPFAVTHL